MNKRELARFQKLIEAERYRVKEGLGMIDEEVKGLAAGQTGNQSYSNHMADAGTDAMETEQAFIHASQGSGYLLELNLALKRIERGKYGVCEECQEKIPNKRLEAYLPARLCVECKGRLEKARRG